MEAIVYIPTITTCASEAKQQWHHTTCLIFNRAYSYLVAIKLRTIHHLRSSKTLLNFLLLQVLRSICRVKSPSCRRMMMIHPPVIYGQA